MRELHLFAGVGGGILGGILLGHTTVAAVEIEPYCQQVLKQRQADGILPDFPIFGDIREFDGKEWRGKVDVICGGFPCQDISVGKSDGDGLDGERSGLWAEMSRVICEVQPVVGVFVENSPALTFRGMGRVLWDLAAMGYDARWGVLGVENTGGCHARRRIWIYANPMRERFQGGDNPAAKAQRSVENSSIQALVQNTSWPDLSDPHAYGSNDGMAYRVERTKAIGNGQVPRVAAAAWRILSA